MKKFILLFASILVIVSCSKEDGIVDEALSNKKVSHTKEGVEDTNITSKSGIKVSICHKNAGEIVVDSAALATHMAHGDAVDMDGDGFYNIENPCSEGIDCDDSDSTINPDATEVVYDGIDNDCNPFTLDDDLDQDGFILAEDCNDNDTTLNPGTVEICDNGIDDNCNGEVDEGCIQIGDLREGGIVFWIDPSDNTRGKVCVISNALLFRNWDDARSYCSNLSLTVNSIEYNDWYLPSNDELNLMWINLADSDGDGLSNPDDPNNLGGFNGNSYWSATEVNDTQASAQEFTRGIQFNAPKFLSYRVRAVRTF